MTVVNFTAPPTVAQFMLDNSFVRLLLGPIGSGKTTGMVMECARRMTSEYPDANRVRKTRIAVVRNTSQQLRQTVLPEIEKWLQPAFRYKVTDSTLEFRFSLPDGTRVESDWMLIPLDTPRDIQRLLSLNLSFAWVSEFREIPVEIIQSILGRVGRFRSLGLTQSAYFGLIAESNMPDEDSEWYNKLELELPSTWKLFKQPGGRDPNAENISNLRPHYYDDLVASNTEDWVRIYVDALYGKSLSGQAVFRASFRPDWHVTYKDLRHQSALPLMLAQDFGRTPASLVTQVDNRGRLLILRELTSEDMGIIKFGETLLRPLMARDFPGMPQFMIADPAGRQKTQSGENSPFDDLKRMGFNVYAAPSNDLDARIRSVEQLLLRQVDGGPALLIDGAHCPQLVQAMKSLYRYKRKLDKTLDEKPEKNHPWSDIADCLQYAALGANGSYAAKVMMDSRPRVRRPPPSAAGWT